MLCGCLWLHPGNKRPVGEDCRVVDREYVVVGAKKPVLPVKLETSLRRMVRRLRVVSFIVSAVIVAVMASKALKSAFTGSDMAFHLLFEKNCGLPQRSQRLIGLYPFF